jgi:hypothetical protein
MLLKHGTRIAALIAASLALAPSAYAAKPKGACRSGETKVHGKCMKTCPTSTPFAQPDDCACPDGFGKVVRGDGSGECSRLACPTSVAFDAKRACDCPPSYERTSPSKGKARCDRAKAAAAK